MKLRFLLIAFTLVTHLYGRSIFRAADPEEPTLIAQWVGDSKTYTFKNTHLEKEPLFKVFDKKQFFDHQLPVTPITFRYNTEQSVSGELLDQCIQTLLQEVKAGKTTFTHFDVLKKKDFNKQQQVGLLILKFKKYPFVVKLFLESPQSFVQPFSKGFEPTCFFYMGGGVNRHISGFTRIKNLTFVQNKIKKHHYWSQKVDFPRKWFWYPKESSWIQLTGKHIGETENIQTTFPAIYAIVADQIIWTREFALSDPKDRKTAMAISNFVDQRVDPHINNFGIEQNSGKIVPIDFELFPLMVGLKQNNKPSGYAAWYTGLALKMVKDTFGRSKQERRNIQQNTILSYLQD